MMRDCVQRDQCGLNNFDGLSRKRFRKSARYFECIILPRLTAAANLTAITETLRLSSLLCSRLEVLETLWRDRFGRVYLCSSAKREFRNGMRVVVLRVSKI